MIILGIDPGYAIVGWGVLEYSHSKFRVLGYGAITTEADTPFPERLQIIYNDMCYLFKKYKPDAMSMEMYGKDIFEYTPLQVKQSVTGYGRAEKKQVQEMTKSILGLPAIPKPDDTADALAMAICHGHTSASSIGRLNNLLNKGDFR